MLDCNPIHLFNIHTEGHILIKMTPKLLMVLLEVRVMSSNVNIWLDTVFQLQ